LEASWPPRISASRGHRHSQRKSIPIYGQVGRGEEHGGVVGAGRKRPHDENFLLRREMARGARHGTPFWANSEAAGSKYQRPVGGIFGFSRRRKTSDGTPPLGDASRSSAERAFLLRDAEANRRLLKF